MPLIKIAQVSTVLLYLIGLPTLWNHWEFLVSLLFQEGWVQGTYSGGLFGVMFTGGFRGLDPAVYRNKNCSNIKTVELTDPGK